MIGIVRGQTARLSVVKTHARGPELPPNPCHVNLKFVDSDGRTIASADVRIAAGQGRYLDFVHDRRPTGGVRPGASSPPDPDRQQIRAVWNAPPDGDSSPPDGDRSTCSSDGFIPTVEVFGRDGETTVLYPGFASPPDPDLPLPR